MSVGKYWTRRCPRMQCSSTSRSRLRDDKRDVSESAVSMKVQASELTLLPQVHPEDLLSYTETEDPCLSRVCVAENLQPNLHTVCVNTHTVKCVNVA